MISDDKIGQQLPFHQTGCCRWCSWEPAQGRVGNVCCSSSAQWHHHSANHEAAQSWHFSTLPSSIKHNAIMSEHSTFHKLNWLRHFHQTFSSTLFHWMLITTAWPTSRYLRPGHVLSSGKSLWVCHTTWPTALYLRKKTGETARGTDRHFTDTIQLPLVTASIIRDHLIHLMHANSHHP